MEIKLNKEIDDYKADIFIGFSLRETIGGALAVLAGLGIYFAPGLQQVSEDIKSYLCMAVAIIIGVIAFTNVDGMTAAQFLVAFVRNMILTPKKLKNLPQNKIADLYMVRIKQAETEMLKEDARIRKEELKAEKQRRKAEKRNRKLKEEEMNVDEQKNPCN